MCLYTPVYTQTCSRYQQHRSSDGATKYMLGSRGSHRAQILGYTGRSSTRGSYRGVIFETNICTRGIQYIMFGGFPKETKKMSWQQAVLAATSVVPPRLLVLNVLQVSVAVSLFRCFLRTRSVAMDRDNWKQRVGSIVRI